MKFYKIVNPEGHHGLVYKNGLNIDPLRFKPYGDCESGGIYFAREDILYFLAYGTELYEVEPVGKVYKNLVGDKKWKCKKLKMKHIGKVLDNIPFLIEQGADIHACGGFVLCWAVENGHLNIVKYLVEHGADIHAYNESALRIAALHGHLDVVKYLVDMGANNHACGDAPLRWAADNGHLDVVEYLKSLK